MTVSEDAMMAIIKESVEAAADRVIARQERVDAVPSRRGPLLTAGHVYLIIGGVALIVLTIIGAVSPHA